MNESPNVVVVLARCSSSKQGFGIRFEEKEPGIWVADWAFAINEASAWREGYDHGEITGTFSFAPSYPCCPFCEAPSIFQCVCGGVACWDGKRSKVTCPRCKTTNELRDQIESLNAGKDR